MRDFGAGGFRWLVFVVLSLSLGAMASENTKPIPGVPVTVEPLGRVAIFPEQEASAQTISLHDSKISAEINAKITNVAVQVGDIVPAGAVLFRLDSSSLEIQLKRAQANLLALEARRKLAKSQAERALSLVQKNFVSREFVNQRQAEFEATTAEFLAQQAEVARIRRDLSKCVIRAPYRGVINARYGQEGEFATPGQPLVNLVGLDHLEVSAKIQASQVDSVRQAKGIFFVSGGSKYPLKLRVLTGVVDPRERTREARFVFSGPAGLPGESGTVTWAASIPHIPPNLLVQRGGRLGVLVRENNTVRFVVLPDAEAGRPASAQGLAPEAAIIVDGRFVLNDGDTVR